MIVRDIMSDFFASAHISSTVGDAMEKMLSEGLSSLLIVDDCSKLVGRIEESLLMQAVFDQQQRKSCASQHMKRDFLAIHPEEPLDQVVDKFLVHRETEFPVLSNGKLVGVVTRRQLLRAVIDRQNRNLRRYSSRVA